MLPQERKEIRPGGALYRPIVVQVLIDAEQSRELDMVGLVKK